MAKIAFHYILKMFPDLTGMEPEFTAIKDFIWTGGDTDRFVRQCEDQFVENFRRGCRPSKWMHILAVERSPTGIIVYAQFFAGPRSLPPPHQVRIGTNPSRIISRPEWRAHQFVILNPTSSIGPVGVMEDFQFALQAHFDFVVADADHNPLFVVEFDSRFHEARPQAKRNAIKNALCKKFGLPLLRVNSNYLLKRYRNYDILSWFVEVWFCSKDWDEAQEFGDIPPVEPFYPFSIIAIPGREERFPFWLSAESLRQIRNLYKAGKCLDPLVRRLVGVDEDGVYRAIGCVQTAEDTAVCAVTGMRSQLFPVQVDDILDELIVCEVHTALIDVMKGRAKPTPLAQVQQKFGEFRRRHTIRAAVLIDHRNGQWMRINF